MSFFDTVPQLAPDPILNIPIAFAADPRPKKVNLGVGTYRDAQGHTYVLTSVQKAEKELLLRKADKEYLPIQGSPAFLQQTTDLIFGKPLADDLTERLFAAQSLGGTGALHVGGEFLAHEVNKLVFISTPTWPNHHLVFKRLGMTVRHYRYYNEKTNAVDFSSMCCDIAKMPPGSILVLQAGCHNPTGVDLSTEQWKELSLLIQIQKVIPFFDAAYLGFGDNFEKDSWPLRFFAAEGHEMLVATSFSKNFTLYNERVGMLTFIAKHKEAIPKIGSQIKQMIRANYSNPPRHGMQIVTDILQSEELRKEWREGLANMHSRLEEMRKTLIAGLQAKGMAKDWSFLLKQKGFFSFCGLHAHQIERLTKDFAIFVPADGRINVAGLNGSNLDYVVDALFHVMSS